MKCNKCGCDEFVEKKVSIHVGAYCKDCGTWLKWVPQKKSIKLDVEPTITSQSFDDGSDDDECPF